MPSFYNQVFTPARDPIPTEALYGKFPADFDFSKPQAAEVPGTRRDGQTGHYRSTIWPNPSELLAAPKPRTLYELVKQVTNEIPDDNALGYLPAVSAKGERPVRYAEEYKWISYGELETTRMEIGSALIHILRSGVLGTPEKIDPNAPTDGGWGVGIWAGNRPEWQMTDMACGAFSLVSVALYDTLGPQATEYVANHAALPIIFTSLAHLPSMLKLLPQVPTVKAVVCYETLEGPEGELARLWAKESGVWIGDWSELKKIGQDNLIGPILPRPETVATLSYTSGTTGNPKGVILTHSAMAAAVVTNAYASSMPERGCIVASYLPLSHVYARFLDLVAVYIRGCAAYSTGDSTRLLADIAIMRPHVFCSVPRVLNRIYAAIMAQASAGGIKGNLLNHAIKVKIANYKATGVYTHAVYDRVIFSKLQALLGGRVVYLSSGSAPISPAVFETLKVCFSVEMIEGWGMTESVGTGSKGRASDPGATGFIGAPVVCNEFKLVDIPEMGYTSHDKPFPRGELCVKGLNLFSGYYKDPKNTKEALDEEGWLHTGDVCMVDPMGRFKIIDRKKNIMKLAQGEYVAIETVEGVYSLSPLFSSFYLHGDSLRNHLVGVGVVDPVQTLLWIKKSIGGKLSEEIQDEADLRRFIESEDGRKLRNEMVKVLKKLAREKGLQGYEHVKGLHLAVEPFPDHLLTPTFKFKRNIVAKHFEKELAVAYDESEEPVVDDHKTKSKL